MFCRVHIKLVTIILMCLHSFYLSSGIILYYHFFFVNLIIHIKVLWFSPGTPVSSTSKTDHHDITEILLKVAFNILTITHIKLSIIINNFCTLSCSVLHVFEVLKLNLKNTDKNYVSTFRRKTNIQMTLST